MPYVCCLGESLDETQATRSAALSKDCGRRVGMTRKLLSVIVAVAVCCTLTSCSAPDPDYSQNLDDVEVAGPGTVGLSVVGEPTKGIVVYFHGADQNARVIRASEKHRTLFNPLLETGYAVVAADAGGNAYGNPQSVEDYRRLIAAARADYGPVPLYFIAESMGALPALSLLREDTQREVKGMVGISPLAGLPAEVRSVTFINGPWSGQIPPAADPLTWAPEVFAGRKFRLYTSPEDNLIPGDASAIAFAERFSPVAQIDIVECEGGHVASECYQGGDVAAWFSSLD